MDIRSVGLGRRLLHYKDDENQQRRSRPRYHMGRLARKSINADCLRKRAPVGQVGDHWGISAVVCLSLFGNAFLASPYWRQQVM